jgi:hypothetical protein
MRLRVCDPPTGIVYCHYMVIENDARLTWSQVSNAALQRVKIQAFNEPCKLRPKRKWQSTDRHQICELHNGWRAYQRGYWANQDASACDEALVGNKN